MPDALLLSGALACSIAGMGWLALAKEVHWRQVQNQAHVKPAANRLRVLGTLALFASLLLCLSADPVPLASLVWIMVLTAGALAVALMLAWRAHWLRLLALAG